MKILVVGMADSVHLGRWLEQFEGADFEFHLFPSSPHRRLHSKIKSLVACGSLRVPWHLRITALPIWLLDRFLSNWFRGALLALESRRVKPDLVHILEFQNAGYLYLRGRKLSRSLAGVSVLLTPYGSDMYWFRRFKRHESKLQDLLSVASAMSCECRRDELIAAELGFTGSFLPRIPAFGTVSRAPGNDTRDQRNSIVIKGYQNRWGRALNAIEAVRRTESRLDGYEIHIFSCNMKTLLAARKWRKESNLQIFTYRKNALSHSEVQQLFSKSLIYLGLSVSDGISASMIEAMANGAIPIQSDTSCCGEWLDHGKGGFLVKYDDIGQIEKHIIFILESLEFRHEAAKLNEAALNKKLNSRSLELAAYSTYKHFKGA